MNENLEVISMANIPILALVPVLSIFLFNKTSFFSGRTPHLTYSLKRLFWEFLEHANQMISPASIKALRVIPVRR